MHDVALLYGEVAALIAWVVVAASLTALCAWGAALLTVGPIGEATGAHWAERARHAYQARKAVTTGAILPPVVIAVFVLSAEPEHGGVTALVAVLVAFWASYPARVYVERRAMPQGMTARDWLRGRFAWWLLMIPHLLITLGLAIVAPRHLGPGSFALLGLAVASAVLVAFGGTLGLARLMGLATPAGPRLAGLVAELAAASKQPVPPTYELDMASANAFAWTRLGAIGVTRRALAALSDDELRAVLAHELGHLAEPRSVALVRSLGMLALTPLVLLRPLLADRLYCPTAVVLWSIVVLLGLVRVVARRMEARADHAAHAAEGDPGTYARALAALYVANGMPSVLPGGGRQHPHLYDRLVTAGATPDWPRPAAPPSARSRLVMVACVLLTVAVAAVCAST